MLYKNIYNHMLLTSGTTKRHAILQLAKSFCGRMATNRTGKTPTVSKQRRDLKKRHILGRIMEMSLS